MKKGGYLDTLLRSPKTVFSTKDISLLWREPVDANARARLHYATRHGQLIHLRRGLYAKDENYNPLELAVKLNIPSYISFETVLTQAGVIFQYDSTIFVASYLSRTIHCDQYLFAFRRLKPAILVDPNGIKHTNEYAIASTERAFLDTLYLYKGYHFDNLSVIDWDKVFELLTIYANKRLAFEVENLHKKYLEEYVL